MSDINGKSIPERYSECESRCRKRYHSVNKGYQRLVAKFFNFIDHAMVDFRVAGDFWWVIDEPNK